MPGSSILITNYQINTKEFLYKKKKEIIRISENPCDVPCNGFGDVDLQGFKKRSQLFWDNFLKFIHKYSFYESSNITNENTRWGFFFLEKLVVLKHITRENFCIKKINQDFIYREKSNYSSSKFQNWCTFVFLEAANAQQITSLFFLIISELLKKGKETRHIKN